MSNLPKADLENTLEKVKLLHSKSLTYTHLHVQIYIYMYR